MCRDPASVFDHPCHVQQIPSHERRVAIGEIVLWTTGTGVQIGWARARLAKPIGVSLWRDDISQVLQRVEHVHRTVLGSVFVPGDQRTAHTTVVGILPLFVEQVAGSVQSLDNLRADRRLFRPARWKSRGPGCRRPSLSRRFAASHLCPSHAPSCQAKHP